MSSNTCFQSADLALSAIALADVPELKFPVKAGTNYTFSFTIFFKTAAATTGVFLSLAAPATTFFRWGKIVPTSATAVRTEVGTASNSGATEAGSAGGTELMARMFGSIKPSADGFLQVRAASKVAASAVTILQGSYGELQ